MKSPSFPPSPLPPTHATKTKKRKRVVAIVVLFVFIVFLSKVFSSSSSSSSSVLLATTENGSSSSSSNNNNNKDDENLRALEEIFLEEESQSTISDDPLDLQFLGLQSSLGGASAACKFQFEIASWRETRLFFALHPECRHLDKCEAELPSQTTLSKQVFDSGGADTIVENAALAEKKWQDAVAEIVELETELQETKTSIVLFSNFLFI